MRFLVLLAIIAAVAWALIRSVREQRQQWLQRLALVGEWHAYKDGVRYHLSFAGEPDNGRYTEVTESAQGRSRETGRWRLVEHTLHFEPDEGAPSACDLRLFEAGRIGLHGPGRERRIYEREADNVVPLPRRSRN